MNPQQPQQPMPMQQVPGGQPVPMQQMPVQQMPVQAQQQLMQTSPLISSGKDNPTSTQATLMISELRDNIVIMKDGSFRAVVACKSINFDLMSDVERESVEYSYQNFLNSLDFTTQIKIGRAHV